MISACYFCYTLIIWNDSGQLKHSMYMFRTRKKSFFGKKLPSLVEVTSWNVGKNKVTMVDSEIAWRVFVGHRHISQFISNFRKQSTMAKSRGGAVRHEVFQWAFRFDVVLHQLVDLQNLRQNSKQHDNLNRDGTGSLQRDPKTWWTRLKSDPVWCLKSKE